MDETPPVSHPPDGMLAPEYRGICEFDGVAFDDRTGRKTVRYDHESVSLGVAVPALVAGCTGVDPVSLPPLYDAVEVDALERLARKNRRTDSGVAITFRYAGYTVTVDDERLSVTPAE